LSLVEYSDTILARAERGVHAASTSKLQAGRVFFALFVLNIEARFNVHLQGDVEAA
jgi:hypothetical protein